MSKPDRDRRKKIEQLRKEGYEARVAGKSIHSCPRVYMYTMDRVHWTDGWWFAEYEINADKEGSTR